MPVGIPAINELVTQEAERIKNEKAAAEQQSQEKVDKEKSEADAAAAAQAEADAAAKAAEEAKALEGKEGAAAPPDDKKAPEEKPDPLAELLKETKFESIDALKAHLTKKDSKEDTPEEKKRKDDLYRANLHNFAVENSLMTTDEIIKYENIKAKSDRDLVFERFAEEIRGEIEDDLKAENADVTKEEIDKEIKEAFEIEYPDDSTNQKAKDRAERKIAKEAKEIRGPFESSFNEAKSRYEDEVSVRNEYPVYQKTIKQVVSDAIPASVNFFKDKVGEQDLSIDIPISEDDKKEILESLTKKLQTPQTFLLHKNGKVDDLKAMVRNEMDYLLWNKYNESGKKEIATKVFSAGLSKGSEVGAKESFALKQAAPAASGKKSDSDAQQEVIDSTRKK